MSKKNIKQNEKSEIDNLNDFMRKTADLIGIHNRVVSCLWKIEHKIAMFEGDMESPVLEALKNNAEKLRESLKQNHSSEIIQQKLHEIEKQAKALFPEKNIDLDSPSFDLRKGLR